MYYNKDYFKKNVSRETFDDLEMFNGILLKWQKAINLISSNTIDSVWFRHIADSYQLYDYFKDDFKNIADIGSGGGFPSIICAILAKQNNRNIKFTLIESDKRKCIFLREVIRKLDLKCTVVNKRIEKSELFGFDVITARALTDINNLLAMADYLKSPKMLLLKGVFWHNEITEAEKHWNIEYTNYNSITEEEAQIVYIHKYSKKY